MTTECKHCGELIAFEKAGNKWIPVDPQTKERHKCKIDVKCQSCGVIFVGEPWKTDCSECWRTNNLDKNRVHRGRGKPQQPASGPEHVEGGWDNGKPPF